VAMSRLVPFSEVLNFRDLGGYRAVDGRETRWGRLFRSDVAHSLSEEDLDVLRDLGIVTVIDLRSALEIERTVSALRRDGSIRFVNASVLTNDGLSERREEATLDESYLTRRYLQYLDVGAGAFVDAFAEMAVAENYPLVFNCFLGKDRTGVLAALVLSCLGIERDCIIEDYAFTATRVPFIVDVLRRDPVYRETIDRTDPILLGATDTTMSSFLNEIDRLYGGARSWALTAGVPQKHLDQLDELLLE
jgi:protein-tyrosine phosphatase